VPGTQVPLAPRQPPWAGFTTPGVKLSLLIGSGVFLLQTVVDTLFEEFVDKEFVERRDVLSHICEEV
jgi:hypothetical protein